eukprot:CAMPEP_0117440352 /NCGR_PEP_ID=MMETSP0759-20121206/3044_1 /TAXON_ID=63605 /ORGANISM="Percolomonas cosmopolitus, Strain WS" /LENGTH=346 /DNA_ID=CAMNT_0005232111 /DNA_START=408 /DNA_END=1448 /DNA_ORIENTATION=+
MTYTPSSPEIPPCSPCSVFFYGLCVVCGANGSRKRGREEDGDSQSSANTRPLKRSRTTKLVDNLRFLVPGISCTDAGLFKELYRDSVKSLMANKKLRLVLDLDETCIHAFRWKQKTNDVIEQHIELDIDEKNGLIMHSSGRVCVSQATEKLNKLPLPAEEYSLDFFDMESGHAVYRIFVRPNLREFLESMQDDYEIFVYSHGTQEYVEAIIHKLGVSHLIQGVLGRFNRRSARKKKSLCRLLSQKTMSVVVDDKKSVWNRSDRDNVIQIPRYSGEKIDNSFPLLENILKNVHTEYFATNSKDVRELLRDVPSLDLDEDLFSDLDLVGEESQDEASILSASDSDSEL